MAIDERRVASIVREEIERYLEQKKQDSLQSESTNLKDDSPGRVLVVFLGTREGVESVLSSLKNLSRAGIGLTGFFSSSASNILDSQQVAKDAELHQILDELPFEDMPAFLRQFRFVIVPSLTRNTAAKLALGITDNATTYCLLSALGSGIPVIAGQDGIQANLEGDSCTTCALSLPGMQTILEGYRRVLESFGMRIVMAKDVGAELQKVILDQDRPTGPTVNGLLTAEEAGALNSQRIVVSSKTIITPLAWDILRQRGIEIETE